VVPPVNQGRSTVQLQYNITSVFPASYCKPNSKQMVWVLMLFGEIIPDCSEKCLQVGKNSEISYYEFQQDKRL
jgi:hypothetical protein